MVNVTAATAVTVPANFTTSLDVVLTSATFNTTAVTKEITDLILSGTFNTDLTSSLFYAVVSTVAYATTPLDSVAVKAATATSKQNTFQLTLDTLPSGKNQLKFLNSAGLADTIDLAAISSTATDFYIYVMREVYDSAPALDNTKFSKDYIPIVITNNEISAGDATAVALTSVTLGSKTYTLAYEESIVEKTFENNLNVSYYVRINIATRKIIEVLDEIKITAEAGSKKSLAKVTPEELQALHVHSGRSVTAGFIFEENLGIGSTSYDVLELQKFLNTNGFPLASSGLGSPGKETGFFGDLTLTALISFQEANSISPASGYFDRSTREKVNAILNAAAAAAAAAPAAALAAEAGAFIAPAADALIAAAIAAIAAAAANAFIAAAIAAEAAAIAAIAAATAATPTQLELPSRTEVILNDNTIDDWINKVRTRVALDDVDVAFNDDFDDFDEVTFNITNQNSYFDQFKAIVDEDDIVDIEIRVVKDSNSNIIINIAGVSYKETNGTTNTSVSAAKILAMKKLLIGLEYDKDVSPFNT